MLLKHYDFVVLLHTISMFLSVTHEANGKVDLHMIWPTPVFLETSAVPGPANNDYKRTIGYLPPFS